VLSGKKGIMKIKNVNLYFYDNLFAKRGEKVRSKKGRIFFAVTAE